MKPGFVAKASRTVNGLENTVDQAWLDFQQALDHHTEIAHKAMRRLVGRLPAKLASDDKGNFVPTGQIHVSKSFYRQLDAIYDQWHDAVLRDLDIPKWDHSKASWTKSLGLLPHKGGRFLLQIRDRILRTVRTLAHHHVTHARAVTESISEHDVLLDVKAIIAESELREFNIYHDPHSGEFTSGGGFSATAEKPVKFKKMSVKGATYLMKYKNPASAVYAKDFGVEPDEAVAHAKAILAGEVEPDTIVPGKATLAAGVLPPHLAAKVSGDAGGADKLPGADEPEGEEPTIDELPPSKLGEPKAYKADDFKVINAHPGGSTGAKIVEDQATGEKFVMKQGTSPEHLENEAVANQAYRAAGINAPDSRMVTVDGKPALLSPYLDDSQTLNDSLNMVDGHSEKEGLLKQAREGFMADAALGNWDAAGANLDNIIYDNKSGKMFRIDNGGSLMYRAQGRMKSASQFKANVPEIGTMLDPNKNPSAAKVFGGITPEEAKQQVADLANNREKILAAIPDKKVRDIVGQRIDWLKNAANEPTAPHSSFTGRDAFGNQWQYGKLVTPESGSGATAKIAMKDAAHPDFATPGKYHYQTHVQLPPGGAEAASTKEAKDAVAKGIPWSDDRYGHVLTAKGQLMYGAAGEKYAKQELLAKGISSKDADKQVAAISKYTGGSYLDLNYHLGNHVATEKELEQVDRVRDYFANSTPMASEKPLTRGTVLAKATMDSLQEDFQNGVTWQTPVVSSFTTGRPKPIGGGKGIKDGVKVDIHVAPGHDAFRPIAHFSQHPESEMEVLALPGTRFKVLKIEKKGSGYDMWVKQHNYKPKVSESISKEEAKKWRIAKQGEEIESEFRDEDGNLIWKAPDPYSKDQLEERWCSIVEAVVPRFKFKFDSAALGKNKIVRPIAGLKVHTPVSAKTGKAVSLKPISKQAHAILKKAEATSAITQQEKGWLENVLRGMDGLARSHANEVYDVATSGPTRQQLLAAVDKFSKGKISKRQLKLSVQTHARAMVRRIVGSDAFKAGTKPPQAFLQIPDTRSGAVANKSTVERAFTIVDRDAHLDAAGGKADSLGLWPGDSIQALPIPEGLDVESEAAAEREKYLKRIQDGFLMPYEEDSE